MEFNSTDPDLLFEHLILGKIQSSIPEKNRFFDAKLDLYGNSYVMDIFETGNSTPFQRERYEGEGAGFEEMEYEVVLEDERFIYVKMGIDSVVRMSREDFETLKTYLSKVKIILKKQETFFNEQIIRLASDMLKNDKLKSMALNFIAGTTQIFLSPKYLVGLEHQLGTRSLLFPSHENFRFPPSEVDHVIKVVNEYQKNEFNMFVKVVQEELTDSNLKKVRKCTYIFLYAMAIKYYSQQWREEYINDFDDIYTLDLENAVERYGSIDTIDHNNSTSIGKFVYYLIDKQKFKDGNRDFVQGVYQFNELLLKYYEKKNYQNFVNKISNIPNIKNKYTINDADTMSGIEFEQFIALLFSKLGYETEITKASGDQGIDIIAVKNGTRIGLQAKCYSGSVGNNAVQEAVAGKNYYRLDKTMVVSNNFFTESAIKLANVNSVVLWDRNILKEKILEVFK